MPVAAVEQRDALGAAGLYLFAFSAWSLRPLAVVGCLLMLWALWADRAVCWPRLRRDPLTWVLLAIAGYAVVYAPLAALGDPASWQQQVKHAARVAYYAGLLPVAWYLRGNEGRLLRAWALVAAGFLLARIAFLGELGGLDGPWWEARLGLGLEPISFAYYAGTLLLGALIFAPRIARLTPRRYRSAVVALLLLLAALLLEGVILSQTRAAWIALAPLLLLVAVLGLRRAWREGSGRTGIAALLATTLLGAVIISNLPAVGQRLASEQETWGALLAGDLDTVRTGSGRARQHSVGIRVVMLREGLARWREAPLFGHGPAAAKLTLRESDVFLLSRFNDYHNVQLDILVRYGVVGLGLFTAAVLLTLGGFYRGWRAGALRGDTALFLGCTLALLLASTLTNVRLLNWDFRYWVFLVAGPLASYRLYCRR
ncbi:MAG: O-antigen ligase family protein [Pseudohaliea sp.]